MTCLKLIIDETLPEGEIILDKEKEILLVRSMEDWFKFMKEYNDD